MRFRLVPTDDRFFGLFSESADNVVQCAIRLREHIDRLADGESLHQLVVACERRGDDITDAILQRLGSSFVTPFDREDIHALAEELDDVVDDMLAVSDLLLLVGVSAPLPELKEQSDLLVQMAEQTQMMMAKLEGMKGLTPFLETIDKLESEGDVVYRRTVARLFSGEYEALEVLRWKDIVQAMEAALNTLEDISDVVESIVLKHA